jgi:probable HAF family extracellular repeat protein
MKVKSILPSAIVISTLLVQITFAALPRYEIIDLGTLGGDRSVAFSINDIGQIVGWAERADASRHAVLFDFNHPANNIDLGTLEGNWSEALSININGCSVGTSHTRQGIYHAALFDPSDPIANIDLGGLGGDFSNAYSINNHSQIVGSSRLYNWDWRATLFNPTGASNNIDLGAGLSNPAGGDRSCALSINNNGQIVGYAHTGTTSIHNRAILFDPSGSGNSIDLTPGNDDAGEAHCINDVGQIVGWSWKTDGAALFNPTGNGHNIALGSLPGAEYSYPYSINNHGHIVGSVTFITYDDDYIDLAVLFDSTGSGNNKNLNDLIDRDSGWLLEVARSINNHGWIVGCGVNPAGQDHAFLMMPLSRTIYVDDDAIGANDGSSWTDAFKYLQDALAAAWSGDEIRVAQGIYIPDSNSTDPNGSGDREATFHLINGVTLKGGYAGFGEPKPNTRDIELYETILSGDLEDNDVELENFEWETLYDFTSHPSRDENSYTVVTGNGTDSTSILDGFTITAGHANNPDADYGNPENNGGGMYNESGSPTLINCTFRLNTIQSIWNSAGTHGGGIYNSNSSPTLRHCHFIENIVFSGDVSSHGGGMCNINSHPALTKCVFRHNIVTGFDDEYYGGGICNYNSNPTLKDCLFIANDAYYSLGGGMHNRENSKPTLINCTFVENTANLGACILDERSDTVLVNCVFSGNLAGYQGGAILTGLNCNLMLTNCTFSGNLASYGRGIYADFGSNTTINNCILWDGGDEIDGLVGSVIASFSNVQGGWMGQGNIDNDPCFVDPGYWDTNGVWVEGDYHLLIGSPCIDAGDPNYIVEPNERDLDGKPRIINGRIDMGAYEYSPPIQAEARILPRTINLASKGNWINCYVRFPEQYNVADIDPQSVFLKEQIKPETFLVNEQQQVATAKFICQDIQAVLKAGDVELKITGQLTDGSCFEAADTIKVLNKTGKN